MDANYTPGSWRHQDWCPSPTGHEGDCWDADRKAKGLPDSEPAITIIDVDALLEQHRAGQHLPPIDPHCPICLDILREARANHRSHAGYPSPVPGGVEERPGWWVIPHGDEECVAAYLHYAQKMSES